MDCKYLINSPILEKLIVTQMVKKFASFRSIRMFVSFLILR
jgi:hypothetical protein